MKRTKLLKHLHRHGCKFLREGGNHTIYTNADGTRKVYYLNSGTCPECSGAMIRLGTCFSCPVCGYGSCSG